MGTVDASLRNGSDRLYELLLARIPQIGPTTIVHGDFRLGNLICQSDSVQAVIDWEIWSIGDPRVDVEWFLLFVDATDLPGAGRHAEGMPSRDELVAEYEATAGQTMKELEWFGALTRFKMAAIMGNNLQRHRTGKRVDPFQERLVDAIPALIQSGIHLLR